MTAGPRPGERLTIYLTARDHVGHHTLVSELLARAREIPVAGVTVFHDAAGFGESTRVHHPHLVGDDAPLRVVVVDTPEQTERFRSAIADLVGDATVVVDHVEIVPPRDHRLVTAVTLTVALAVALGGLVGAPARNLVDTWVTDHITGDLPWGTAAVNVSGSVVLGVVTGLLLHHHVGPVPRALVATGFCGAYTTFSTFTFETMTLLEDGRMAEATLNVVGSLAVGLLAAAAGLAIGLAL